MLNANLGMLMVALSWGTMIPSMAHLLGGWDPYFLALERYLVPALPQLILLRWREPGLPFFAGFPAWRWWLLATVGIGIFPALFTVGLNHANPITAAILSAGSPIMTAAVGRLAFGTPIPRRMLPGVLLTVIGCIYATYDPALPGRPFDLRGGEILIIAAMACWSWYSITAQRWMRGCSQLRIAGITTALGSVVLVAIYLLAGVLGAADLPPAVPHARVDLGLLVWIAFGPVMAGNLLWGHGVRTLGPVVAALFMNLIPLCSVLIMAAAGVTPTPQQLTGGAVVLVGIMLAQLRGQ